jgi:hypothetical protein
LSRLKRPYTPAGFSKEQKDILLAYASANPDWQGEFTAELAERLAGSKYKPSTQEKLVKKFYEGLQDGLTSGLTPVQMSDTEAPSSVSPPSDVRTAIAQSHLKPSPFVMAAMANQAVREGRMPLAAPSVAPSSPKHQYTVRADLRILGYIGAEQHFFLLCPVFPYADGPDVRIGGISGDMREKITVEYTWPEERLERDEDRDEDSPPLDFIQEFIRHDSAGVSVPPCVYSVDVTLPHPYRAADLLKGPPTRTPTTRWAVFEFTTDASRKPLTYSTVRPFQPKRRSLSPSAPAKLH